MGYMVAGVCVETQIDALAAFNGLFPRVDGSLIYSMDYSVFSSASVLTAWIQNNNLLTGALSGVWVDMPIPSCVVPLPTGFDQIFNVPASADLTTVWMVAFSLPMILWLTAWGFGVVVNMFKDDK